MEAFTGPISFNPAKKVMMAMRVDTRVMDTIQPHCSMFVGGVIFEANPYITYTDADPAIMTPVATMGVVPLIAFVPTMIYMEYIKAAPKPKIMPLKFIFSNFNPTTKMAPMVVKINAMISCL